VSAHGPDAVRDQRGATRTGRQQLQGHVAVTRPGHAAVTRRAAPVSQARRPRRAACRTRPT
jgi:hypothetical protein